MRFVGPIHVIQLKSISGMRFSSWSNDGSFDVPKVGMARMIGWIWPILAGWLLGRVSISLMTPARGTVGLHWINRRFVRMLSIRLRYGGLPTPRAARSPLGRHRAGPVPALAGRCRERPQQPVALPWDLAPRAGPGRGVAPSRR